MPILARAPQLLVTRTLSKAFGLAGLRVGYGLAAPEIVQVLEKVRGPYKVNVLGEKAALAALAEDVPWVWQRVEMAVAIRERLCVGLEALGLRALPSAANFLCIPVPDSSVLGRALLGKGIKVRVLRQLPGIGDAIRVGVGPWEQMERLVCTLREVLR